MNNKNLIIKTMKFFDISSVEGLIKAEKTKIEFENKYEAVKTETVGLDKVVIVAMGSRH